MFASWFQSLKKQKKQPREMIFSPAEGCAILLEDVPDPAFSQGLLGKGAAIMPVNGRITAPADGEVAVMFDTCHAVCIRTETGAEIMIHVGLDTVQLEGKFFQAHVATGDRVKCGDLLLEYDKCAVEKAVYNVVTPVVLCNTEEYTDVIPHTGKVLSGDILLEVDK